MIKISNFGDITRFDFSRSIAGRGIYWTTAYLVDGLMVDTGCAHTSHELLALISGTKLDQIINTHSHEDHIGANACLHEINPELQLFAHPLALPVLEKPEAYQPLQAYRRFVWGIPSPSKAQPLINGGFIETDKYHFLVIYTPGHTLDHLCLYEPDQEWVFTGDLYVGGKDRAVRAGSDIWQTIESLKLISELPLKGMYPNSARVRLDPVKDLQTKIGYLEMLGDRVLNLADQGYSIGEISRTLFGGPLWIELITWGHLSRRNLVRSYLDLQPVSQLCCRSHHGP